MTPLWQIVHIDLAQELLPLPALESEQGIFAVFWYHDVPLGHWWIRAVKLPMTAEQLADAALKAIGSTIDGYGTELGLETLELRHAVRSMQMKGAGSEALSLLKEILTWFDHEWSRPPIRTNLDQSLTSVVIPTCNRPERLAACLQSLQALHQPSPDIVVVDNAPQFPYTRRLVKQFSTVRYVPESRPGASAARNTGVRHARGALIAFVDDDETVHPNWLTWMRQCFHNPAVALATGLVLPAELDTEAQLLFESRFSFIRGYYPRMFNTTFFRRLRPQGVPVWVMGGSGNMAIRRDVFEQIGGFDERLGAGRAGCSEDTELFYRALARGAQCRYEPRSVTYHYHRRDMTSLKQQLFLYMRGHVAASLVQHAKHNDRGNLRHLVWGLPKTYIGYGLRCFTTNPAFQLSLLRTEIAGCLAGWRFYWRHRVDTVGVQMLQGAPPEA